MFITIPVPVIKGKADYLVDNHGALRMSGYMPIAELDEVLVCIIGDGEDIAAIAYDEEQITKIIGEMDDIRPRTWLLMKKEEVIQLAPHVKSLLEGV